MRGFIRYYKWHLILITVAVVCIVYVVVNLTATNTPDLVFGYVGTQYVNRQTFEDYSSQVELLLRDADGDDKKEAVLITTTCDIQEDADEVFKEMIEDGQYDIYIAAKETFENFEDKSRFEEVDTYATVRDKDNTTLSDKSGREYAISLKGNEYVKNMGFINPDSLYLAVAAPGKGNAATTTQKNGRNVAGIIIEDDQ